MKPNKIVLMRHFQSEGNINKLIYGEKPDYEIGLTEYGKLQAKESGERLKYLFGCQRVAVHVSPFHRAWETAKLVEDYFYGVDWREDIRLREWEHGGPMQGHVVEEFAMRGPRHHHYYKHQNGESLAQCEDRVCSYIETLYRLFQSDYYPDNMLIVSHGMTLRLLLKNFFGWSVERFEEMANPRNGEIIVIEHIIHPFGDFYKLETELRKRKHV